MQKPPLPNPAIVVKDALRGVRYAVQKGGQMLASQKNPFVPDEIKDVTSRILSKAEQVSDDLGGIAASALGAPFSRREFPPAGVIGAAGFPGETNGAYVLYRALSYTAGWMAVENALVSELVCGECLRQYALAAPGLADADKAVVLFRLITERKVIGNPPGLRQNQAEQDRTSSAAADFAAVLWLFVPRGAGVENEAEMLEFCCEIAADNAADIAAKQNDPAAMEVLFKHFLAMV